MKNIQKIIVKTKNVKQSISIYADANAISFDKCDFSINKVETLIKEISTHEFKFIDKTILPKYLNRDKILNEHIEFSQIYTISIYPKKESKLQLQCIIKNKEYSCEPKIILEPKSKIPKKLYAPKEMLILLFKELNKIKLLNGFLINIFDEEMKKNLTTFVKHLYSGKFTKRIQITLFNGIHPVVTRDAKLIFWYKEKNSDTLVIEVNKDEILIEYKKPVFGKNGLNAYGKEISAEIANNSGDLDVEIDTASISIKEDKNSKFYKSKQQGFVHFDNKTLSIDNKIKLSTLSRNENAIASEEDNNIKVIISQHDTAQDSIGEGVELVSEFIHVTGFVGSKSVLEAVDLTIDGATHQDSKQIAKFAKINRHKGKLRCHEAKINLLEGGEVTATKVEIESSLGGTIRAIDVKIGHVKSNLKVYASNSITIRLMSGEDNTLNIDYTKVPITASKIAFIKKDIDELKYELEEAKRHHKDKVQNIQKDIKSLREDELSILKSHQNAYIKIEKPLNGLNNIIFTIDSDNEIIFKTEAKTYDSFHLEIQENKITLLPVNKSLTI